MNSMKSPKPKHKSKPKSRPKPDPTQFAIDFYKQYGEVMSRLANS